MGRPMIDDDRTLWSLFLPIALAVAFGVLLADGVRYAVVQVFVDRLASSPDTIDLPRSIAAPAVAPTRTQPAPADVAPAASTAAADAGKATSPTDATTAVPTPPPSAASAAAPDAMTADSQAPSSATATPSTAVASPPPGTAAPDAIERLPGSTVARRDGLPRACIDGRVAVRSRNGWQQELSFDRPVRCEQIGP